MAEERPLFWMPANFIWDNVFERKHAMPALTAFVTAEGGLMQNDLEGCEG
jgi:hypothetical protein